MPSGEALQKALGWARVQVYQYVQEIEECFQDLSDAEFLRALIARLPDGDTLEAALQLVAAPAVFIPFIHHLRKGTGCGTTICPHADVCHDVDTLRMYYGMMPDEDTLKAYSLYLQAMADCSFSPAARAARIVAATGAGYVSSVVSAFSAFKGMTVENEKSEILMTLDAIYFPDRVEGWIKRAVNENDLHGILEKGTAKTDWQIEILKQALEMLARNPDENTPDRAPLVEAIETATRKLCPKDAEGNMLKPSVAFYQEILLEKLGFEPCSYINLKALNQVVEWIAHARDEYLITNTQV